MRMRLLDLLREPLHLDGRCRLSQGHLQRSKLDVREVRAASEVQGHGLERGQQDKAMQPARVLEEGAVT